MSTDSSMAVLGVDQQALDTMKDWSDTKKADFVQTFEQRASVAKYLLRAEANIIFERAMARKFISDKHAALLNKRLSKVGGLHFNESSYMDPMKGQHNYYERSTKVGGRDVSELDAIAEERAAAVIKHLPSLASAVRMVSKETADKIDKRDKLAKQAAELHDKVQEVSKTISMKECIKQDSSFTCQQFLDLVDRRQEERDQLVLKLNKVSKAGSELELEIAKDLYAGLPGLSEAVCDVIYEKIQSAEGFDACARRVSELVKFGDSQAALGILQQFEKDEKTLDISIADKFKSAIEVLKKGTLGETKATKRIKG